MDRYCWFSRIFAFHRCRFLFWLISMFDDCILGGITLLQWLGHFNSIEIVGFFLDQRYAGQFQKKNGHVGEKLKNHNLHCDASPMMISSCIEITHQYWPLCLFEFNSKQLNLIQIFELIGAKQKSMIITNASHQPIEVQMPISLLNYIGFVMLLSNVDVKRNQTVAQLTKHKYVLVWKNIVFCAQLHNI